jgi:hypothetical protein
MVEFAYGCEVEVWRKIYFDGRIGDLQMADLTAFATRAAFSGGETSLVKFLQVSIYFPRVGETAASDEDISHPLPKPVSQNDPERTSILELTKR